jgi:poly(3-hydroxybutyrate) depolymerase
MKHRATIALLASSCLLALPALAASPPLPALGANLAAASVSGISSGGYMAAQLATAYSSRFMGVGVIAAGPYYCSGTFPKLSLLENATTTCMSPSIAAVAADAEVSWKNASSFAADKLIDPVGNLAGQGVYIFSGSNDHTVKTMVVDQVEKYYQLAGVAPQRILYRKNEAGHAIVTSDSDDVPCADTDAPYINNCGFVQSHELLRHLYGQDGAAANDGVPKGMLIKFDQREFFKGSTRSSMNETGFAYVPQDCQKESCKVHIALHGCEQGRRTIGDRFYNGTGYNEYADNNKIIILYPQAKASKGIPPNPKGCWDFWGYSNEGKVPPFYAKGAPQMAAIIAMLDRLGAARGKPMSTQP